MTNLGRCPVFRIVAMVPYLAGGGGTKDFGDRSRTTHDDTELELLEGALGPQPRCFMVILEGRNVLSIPQQQQGLYW